MNVTLVRVLGWPRSLIAGGLIVAGAFFVFALSQAGHFGWGFQYLDAALNYVLVLPFVLFVDSLLIIVRLLGRRRQEDSPETRQILVAYLAVLCMVLGLFCIAVMCPAGPDSVAKRIPGPATSGLVNRALEAGMLYPLPIAGITTF